MARLRRFEMYLRWRDPGFSETKPKQLILVNQEDADRDILMTVQQKCFQFKAKMVSCSITEINPNEIKEIGRPLKHLSPFYSDDVMRVAGRL